MSGALPSRASVPSAARLSPLEAQTLRAWRDYEPGSGLSFKAVNRRCKTPKTNIRRAVRALARKGMVRFEQMLFDDCTGKCAGAGYVLTWAGERMLHPRPAPDSPSPGDQHDR